MDQQCSFTHSSSLCKESSLSSKVVEPGETGWGSRRAGYPSLLEIHILWALMRNPDRLSSISLELPVMQWRKWKQNVHVQEKSQQESSLDVLCVSAWAVHKTVGDIWKESLGEWLVLPASYPAGVGWTVTQTPLWCVLLLGRTLGWLLWQKSQTILNKPKRQAFLFNVKQIFVIDSQWTMWRQMSCCLEMGSRFPNILPSRVMPIDLGSL